MNKLLLPGYEAGTRLQFGKRHIVITPLSKDAADGIMDYQLKMLAYNQVSGVITPEITVLNDEPEISYDVTGLIPVRAAGMSPDGFARFIKEAARALLEAPIYLLSQSAFIFEDGYVFTEPGSGRFKFIYLPVKMTSIESPLHAFKKYASGASDLQSGPSAEKIKSILGQRETEMLHMLIDSVDVTGEVSSQEEPEADLHLKADKNKRDIRIYIWGAGVVGIFAALLYLYENYLYDLSPRAAVVATLAGCGAGAGIFLRRVIYKKLPKNEEHVITDAELLIDMTQESGNECMSYETVLLEQPVPTANAVLISADGSESRLEPKRYTIGRSREFSDIYIPELTIGRMHAELTYNDGAWRLTDKASKNGTCVNGIRLEPDEPLELNHNDVVEFADRAFTFQILDK